MPTTIRELEADDRGDVGDLADRLSEGVARWRDRSAVSRAVRGWIAESTSPDFAGTAFVAIDDDDHIVGFVSLSTTTHFAGETDAYIGELVVAASNEGRGVGTELIAAAERRAKADGRRCITLTTGAANERALRFYRKLGYVEEDVKLTKVLSG